MTKKTIHLIAGARPNFMKIAPLWHALAACPWCRPVIVHTGQHYNANMSEQFFQDFAIDEPEYHLGVGSGTHAVQTASVMTAYDAIIEKDLPDLVVVVGDVNSTIAAALVASKRGIPLAHLEAGLRSYDRAMPEEINRILTDSIADILWTPSPDADENLRRENVSDSRIERVGNIMIDSFEMLRDKIEADTTAHELGLEAQGYGVVTLHRPSNVDDRSVLTSIVSMLCNLSADLPLAFPIHPRTHQALDKFDLTSLLENANIHLLEPLGYIQFMGLVSGSRLVITDSGGIQEETSYLGIPCLTLRANTERPITVTEGTNQLVTDDDLLARVKDVLAGPKRKSTAIDLWDGHTASRILEHIKEFLDVQ